MATHGALASVRPMREACAPTHSGAPRVDVGSREQCRDRTVGRRGDVSAVQRLLPQRGEPLLIVARDMRVDGHRVALSSLTSG